MGDGMGFDPITMGVVSAGLNIGGQMLNRREKGKAVNKANEANAARTQAAMSYLSPAYQRGADMRQQAMNRGLDLYGQTFMPAMQAQQAGNLAAQRYISQGLPMQRAALLGGKVDYSQMQPTEIPINQTALAGIINPTRMDIGMSGLPQMTPEMMRVLR